MRRYHDTMLISRSDMNSMINDSATDPLIYWSTDGKSFFSQYTYSYLLHHAYQTVRLNGMDLTFDSPKCSAVRSDFTTSVLQTSEFHKFRSTVEYVSLTSLFVAKPWLIHSLSYSSGMVLVSYARDGESSVRNMLKMSFV